MIIDWWLQQLVCHHWVQVVRTDAVFYVEGEDVHKVVSWMQRTQLGFRLNLSFKMASISLVNLWVLLRLLNFPESTIFSNCSQSCCPVSDHASPDSSPTNPPRHSSLLIIHLPATTALDQYQPSRPPHPQPPEPAPILSNFSRFPQ